MDRVSDRKAGMQTLEVILQYDTAIHIAIFITLMPVELSMRKSLYKRQKEKKSFVLLDVPMKTALSFFINHW